MKNLTLLILFTCINVFAQNNEITSEGKAKIKVKPDVVTLKIDVRKVNEAEAEALKELNLEMDVLQKFLSKAGIPLKQIKISDYSINSNTRYNADKKMFTALASLSVEMKLDYKLLDAFYTEIQSGRYKDVTVNYTTSLSESLQSKSQASLTHAAIKDAKQNAENIAKALNVTIMGIKNVSKNGRAVNYDGVADNAVYSASYETVPQTIFTKFEVVEKELEERITIVFTIMNQLGKY